MNFNKDSDFTRNNENQKTIPLTKREIRILTLGLMGVNPTDRFLDLGGGTGGIACEAAKLAYNNEVISVDKNRAACELIKKNKAKFKLDNLKIVHEDSVKFLRSYSGPKFNKIFIGGSSGFLKEIIKDSIKVLDENGTIAANFITLDNCYIGYKYLKKHFNSTELINVNIAHSTEQKEHIMFKAQNPVFILVANNIN